MARKREKGSRKTNTTSGNYRRGKGHRGGFGGAGRGKRASHRKQAFIKAGLKLGKKGFKRPQNLIKEKRTINIGELCEKSKELVEAGFAEEKNGSIMIDLEEMGIDKVLGKGRVNEPLTIKAKNFSKKAKEKIKEAGGKIKE